ncbi:MAG: PcfB family protein [Clostridium sp.]|uniref:PcfB family protein n=1 Tax=Clostridium sp. TaxID=1506 RepID=UPI002A90E6B1|nr:PcfB family protein [Clostridium sp.]MDY6228818.1 PcfB family protein [Clostridium sp.]
MLGEEMGEKAISVSVKASQITSKILLEVMKSIANRKYKVVTGKQTIKDLNKKGRALENVNIDKTDLKSIQRILKKDGIDFAIKKDINKEVFNLYFKAQDISQIEKIFKDYASKNFKDLKKDKGVKEVVEEAKVKAEAHNKKVEVKNKEKVFVKDRGDR